MSKVFTITNGLENLGAFRTGGQGSVYKGRRTGEIITAVKLLPTPILNEDEGDKNFRDFRNEVEKLKKVNENPSPNVVKILNSGLTDSGSFPFIEMEYIEGQDLEELLKPPHDRIFKLKDVIRVTEQLANALAHCHAVNVKHGDIKSNNVKYNAHTGNYVLLDFGLAIMSDEQRRTSLRQAGAIEFMAPEQYDGLMLQESDIYSYGVVIYEILTGQVPFPLSDNSETARNNVRVSHLETAVPDVLEIRRKNTPVTWPQEEQEREMQVPQWLIVLLGKCLEKKPENRFSNGMVLHDFIQRNSISQARISDAEYEQHTGYQKLLAEKDLEISNLEEQLQRALKSQRSTVRVPAPLFFVTLILLSGMVLFAGYSMFMRSGSQAVAAEYPPADPNNKNNSTADLIHPAVSKTLPYPVVLNIDSLKNEELKRQIEKKAAVAAASKIREPEEEKPKKKKKFLRFLFK